MVFFPGYVRYFSYRIFSSLGGDIFPGVAVSFLRYLFRDLLFNFCERAFPRSLRCNERGFREFSVP